MESSLNFFCKLRIQHKKYNKTDIKDLVAYFSVMWYNEIIRVSTVSEEAKYGFF